MLFAFNSYLDLVTFGLTTLLVTAVVGWVIARAGQRRLAIRMSGLVVLLSLTFLLFAFNAGERERRRLVEMVSGAAPTYARILTENGLDQITLDTPADDPTYLKLIALQKNLLEVNPTVADIYTLAKRPDGKRVLVVDSETDYNRNGVYDEEREARTDIGEVYEDESFGQVMDAALAGQSAFMDTISADRWGVWVSAIEPLRDREGRIFGVLGVDFPADRWVQSIFIVRGSSLMIGLVVNAVVLVAGFMISRLQGEIARRNVAETEARASENRLRLILDNEPESVLVLDWNRTIIESNPAGIRLLAEAGRSPVGRALEEFILPEGRPKLHETLDAVFAGRPGAFEVAIQSPNNTDEPSWLDVHCVPLRDVSGQVTSTLLVARDVTARRKAEAEREQLQLQLVDASRQAGMAEIATGVLHNVGNVLNSVNVSVNLITQRVSHMRLPSFARLLELLETQKSNLGQFVTEDARGKCLPQFLQQLYACLSDDQKTINTELQQLSSGIEHIKEVVRMQQSCASVSSTVLMPLDPTQIMEEAIKVNMVSMERHQVQLDRDYEPGLELLPLDKHKILQILINLIGNAKRATCDESVTERKITVSVRKTDGGNSLEFRVRDNGVGIDPANVKKLFRHGFTTRKDGHGFGLHSSANAAGEMKGTLRGESEGLGKGATFVLTLPITAAKMGVAA